MEYRQIAAWLLSIPIFLITAKGVIYELGILEQFLGLLCISSTKNLKKKKQSWALFLDIQVH